MRGVGLAMPPKRLAIAVSGGPDSMALAWCVKGWGAEAILALIVDHGLRPESGEEARVVQQRLAALGIRAEILRWEHGEVASGVHKQARQARYALLAEACRRHGITDLLLAHHADDQAETVLMRFAKGSGIDGLGGMAPVTEINGLRLLRPFLSISKARLLATCETAKLSYVTDPSNAQTKYARGRLRRVMPLLEAEGFSRERLLDLAERAREASEALDHATGALLREAAQIDGTGTVRLSLAPLRQAPKAVALRTLAACLQAVHVGASYPPERRLLLPLYEALTVPFPPRTLYGCCVTGTEKSLRFNREPAAVTEIQSIAPGETILWDKRWRISLPASAESGLTVRALGLPSHKTLDRLAPGLRRGVPQGQVRAALPALWRKGELAAIPFFSKVSPTPPPPEVAKASLEPERTPSLFSL